MKKEMLPDLLAQIKTLGATQAAVLPVSDIVFHLEFRAMCQSNACGMYGKCWTCPPHVGEPEALISHARSFDTVVVYQTVSPLEDSYDIEGMLAAGERQNELTQAVQALMRKAGEPRFLHLGAGGCRRCAVCAKAEDKPCRFPDEALASLEGYCIDVSQLAASCGMRYINGVNTVTYFSALFLNT